MLTSAMIGASACAMVSTKFVGSIVMYLTSEQLR